MEEILANFEKRGMFLLMKKICFLFAILIVSPVFSAGTLNISYIQNNSQKVVPRNAVRLPLAHINFLAEEEDVLVGDIIFLLQGMSSPKDFGRMWIETDSFQRSRRTSVQTDGTVIFRFPTPVLLEKNKRKDITLYGNLKISAPGTGRTFSFVPFALETDASKITLDIPEESPRSASAHRE